MALRRHVAVAAVVAAALLFGACGEDTASVALESPATVAPVEGSEFSRVTLTQRAVQRLDLQTQPVKKSDAGTTIPYSALLYSPTGETWTYVSPEPLNFIRQEVVVDTIAGDVAVLSKGPPVGARVVTVGAAELFGVESGLGQ